MYSPGHIKIVWRTLTISLSVFALFFLFGVGVTKAVNWSQLDYSYDLFSYDHAGHYDDASGYNLVIIPYATTTIQSLSLYVSGSADDSGNYPAICYDTTIWIESQCVHTEAINLPSGGTVTITPNWELSPTAHYIHILYSSGTNFHLLGKSMVNWSSDIFCTSSHYGANSCSEDLPFIQYFNISALTGSEPTPTGSTTLTWYWPIDGGTYNNSEINDWQLYYEIAPDDLTSDMYIQIYYTDVNGVTHEDSDQIVSTTDLTSWTLDRTSNLPDGLTYAYGVLWAFGSSTVTQVAETNIIDFTIDNNSSNTIFNDPYARRAGFIPNIASSCAEITADNDPCTEAENFIECGLKHFGHWFTVPSQTACIKYYQGMEALKNGFPMNVINQISITSEMATATNVIAPLKWWNRNTHQYEDTGETLMSTTSIVNALSFGNIQGMTLYQFYILWFKRFCWLSGLAYVFFRIFKHGHRGFHFSTSKDQLSKAKINNETDRFQKYGF